MHKINHIGVREELFVALVFGSVELKWKSTKFIGQINSAYEPQRSETGGHRGEEGGFCCLEFVGRTGNELDLVEDLF